MTDLLDDDQIAMTMQRYGGGFARALAIAWYRADDENRRRIQDAFPEFWTTYTELARLAQAKGHL